MERLASIGASFAMLVIAGAGLLKLLDIGAFHLALRSWGFLPRPLVPFLTIVIPCTELLAGGLWIVGFWRRTILAGMIAFLSLASAAYAAHLWFASAPDCGCLGILAQYSWAVEISRYVLPRNLFLLFLLIAARLLGARPALPAPVSAAPFAAPPRTPAPRAFSVIELILTIALVGLLLTLIIPSLARTRLAARVAASSAQIRSHASLFNAYANDYRGLMPYVTEPDAHYTVLRAGNIAYPTLYFEAVNRWHLGLAAGYYEDDPLSPSFSFPGEPRLPFTTYNYSQTFLADPAYWRDTTRTGPAQWRAVRADEALFPSAKTLLVDSQSERLRRPIPDTVGGSPVLAAFVDASARQIPLAGFTRGYPQQTGWEWPGVFNSVVPIGMHTIDGVRGRDVE